MKKLIGLLSGSLMLALVAGPVSAQRFEFDWTPRINMMKTKIEAITQATSDTGLNYQGNYSSVVDAEVDDDVNFYGENNLLTGVANSNAENIVQVDRVPLCALCAVEDDDDIMTFNYDKLKIEAAALASSNTGYNLQENSLFVGSEYDPDNVNFAGVNNMTTGDANSNASSMILVNANWMVE